MSTATELLRRALDALEWCDEECCDEPLEKAIRTFLATELEANEHSISGAIAFTNGYHGGRCTVLPSNPAMVIPAGIPLYTRQRPEAEPVEIVPRKWRNTLQKLVFLVRFQTGNTAIQSVCNEASLLLSKPYLHPPKPAEPKAEPVAWQGLKMHEVVSLWSEALDPAYFARAIEQALKEKNTKPEPARKPMTDEELRKAFLSANTAEPLCEGWPGLERFARAIEKHHGIGINKSDPDSIDLQSRCRGDKL